MEYIEIGWFILAENKIRAFLKNCKTILESYGFKLIPTENLNMGENVIAAYSELEVNLRKFPVIYTTFYIDSENELDFTIFRFEIEIQGPYTCENFGKLCEYVSKIAPYLLLGSIYVKNKNEMVSINLSYDAIIDLTKEPRNLNKISQMIFSLMSCGLLVISKRLYDIGIGNYEVLENEQLFNEDISKLVIMDN